MRSGAKKAGWQLQDEPPQTHSLAMSNDTMTVAVAAIAEEQGLVIVSVYERDGKAVHLRKRDPVSLAAVDEVSGDLETPPGSVAG